MAIKLVLKLPNQLALKFGTIKLVLKKDNQIAIPFGLKNINYIYGKYHTRI